ncbi:hypothetical protein BST25_01155 [Mycobacterium heidelbergense]|uniref:Uncharacterized protein n=1 Tax=Mycobacterium heidelbergense TaxID=53376 RepID=A0A1X0DVE9_MYCHE|nr:hypothetical protein BST25_01155 [Mycobacterium heidelbergense]BBZ51040.1 hypothetical protein MHEI_27570 [Mycobacterium heidelbergense]
MVAHQRISSQLGDAQGRHYRLFCRLDTEAQKVHLPILAAIAGMGKAVRTILNETDYAQVRELSGEYWPGSSPLGTDNVILRFV